MLLVVSAAGAAGGTGTESAKPRRKVEAEYWNSFAGTSTATTL